jgi:hypothetical protein
VTQETLYKFTDVAGRPIHNGTGRWLLPKNGLPGEWMPVVADPKACYRGYHLVTGERLLRWIGPALWVAEGRGKCDSSEADKLCFEQARLVRRVEGWNERTQRVFACDCAERVVRLCGDDPRPAEAIRVARLYADGNATIEELSAASAAASAAAWAAASDAAWAAASAAASDAASDAARAAAWAARAAARAAAWAASDAARAAARAAEHAWQTQHLLELIGEAPSALPLEVA